MSPLRGVRRVILNVWFLAGVGMQEFEERKEVRASRATLWAVVRPCGKVLLFLVLIPCLAGFHC